MFLTVIKNVMKINYQPCTSFKSELISRRNIQKYEPETDTYKDVEASFVEINPKDKHDRNSVNDAVFSWDNDSYGMNISNTMENLAESDEDISSDKIFAITTQKDRLWKLDPDSIKALAHVFESKKRVRVVYLQVDPSLIYTLSNPNYKHVGKGMIDSLKELILNGAGGLKCPRCGAPLISKIEVMYDLEDNEVQHPKAHCTKCVFQIK